MVMANELAVKLHFYLDKKSSKGSIAFILPNGKIGTHIIKKDIPKDVVIESLKKFEVKKV